MRLTHIPGCVLVALACVATPAYAQYQTPDEAAVSGLLQSLKRPVKLDPRYGKGADGQLRPQSVTASISKLLGNAEVEEFEQARNCGPYNMEAGEYPWTHCDLSGAASLVLVGKPEIDGDAATVHFTVWTHYSERRVQPVAAASFRATVARQDQGWVVVRVEGIAST